MKLKKFKQKIAFINDLEKLNHQSVRESIHVISMLSHDKNTDVKVALAKQLVLFDNDEIEDILCNMLYDKNRMVRLEALDSICIGHHEKTIQKISEMLEGEGCLIRMYAVMTLFDVITNSYGINEIAFEKYRRIIEQSFRHEKNAKVLTSYFQSECYMEDEKGVLSLKRMYMESLENENYDLIWTILHVFKSIRNRNNDSVLKQIVAHKTDKLLPVQKVFVEDMNTEKVPYKILILDEDNAFLAHAVALMLKSMCNKEELLIETAGVSAGILRLNDIRYYCERNNMKFPDNIFCRRITEAYRYDCIFGLNIDISPYKYSKMETVYNENMEQDERLFEICKDIMKRLKDKGII